jgi:hypothetical protein
MEKRLAMKHGDVWMNMGEEAVEVVLRLMFIWHHFLGNSYSGIGARLRGKIDFEFFHSWSFSKFIAVRNIWSYIELRICSILEGVRQ